MLKKQGALLIASSIIIIALMVVSFKNKDVFWYLYSFTLLLGMALAFSSGEIMDRLSTARYFFIGVPLGIIGYLSMLGIYKLLPHLSPAAFDNVKNLLETYSPNNLWQYILLLLVIVVGEEMLWRAYIQQALKKFFSVNVAILLTALHFSLALLLCGYYIGAIAAFLTSIIFGAIYEWLKSLPLLIVAHLMMVLLLFLLLPLI